MGPLPVFPFNLPNTSSEEAVEHGELDDFLRLNESYDVAVDEDRPAPVVQPIGVPGAVMPLQMTPERLRTKLLSSSPSPLKGKGTSIPVNKREGEFDISTELSGFGLQGVMVTGDELADLVAELGLDGDDAGDLVKGLSNNASAKSEGAPGDTGKDRASLPAMNNDDKERVVVDDMERVMKERSSSDIDASAKD